MTMKGWRPAIARVYAFGTGFCEQIGNLCGSLDTFFIAVPGLKTNSSSNIYTVWYPSNPPAGHKAPADPSRALAPPQ